MVRGAGERTASNEEEPANRVWARGPSWGTDVRGAGHFACLPLARPLLLQLTPV